MRFDEKHELASCCHLEDKSDTVTSDKQMTVFFLPSSEKKPVAYQFSMYHSYLSVNTGHARIMNIHLDWILLKYCERIHVVCLCAGIIG